MIFKVLSNLTSLIFITKSEGQLRTVFYTHFPVTIVTAIAYATFVIACSVLTTLGFTHTTITYMVRQRQGNIKASIKVVTEKNLQDRNTISRQQFPITLTYQYLPGILRLTGPPFNAPSPIQFII